MRRTLVALAAVLLLSLVSCCSVERQAVENLGNTQDLINREFLKYVSVDPKLDAKARDDWAKLVRSENDLRAGLIKK